MSKADCVEPSGDFRGSESSTNCVSDPARPSASASRGRVDCKRFAQSAGPPVVYPGQGTLMKWFAHSSVSMLPPGSRIFGLGVSDCNF